MDTVVNKIEKKENEEKKEREKIKEMIEKQLKNEEDKKNENNKNKNDKDEQFQINELNNIDNMNIPLTEKLLKKKKILSQLSNEQLMEYTLKLERLNISLKSEKNKKDQQIKEKNETIESLNKAILSKKKDIGALNNEINKLKKLNIDLQSEVKTNEIFRPSIAMNGSMRISRMSKLTTIGLNAMKFGGGFNKNENKIVMNSNDYFKNDKNMNFSIKNKKNIKTAKLKDKNINLQIGKEQKTKFTPQNILNTIYGDEDKINEEINEDENEKNEEEKDKNNNNNLEVSKNLESTIKGQKIPFTNLEQNGIEFNIQKNVNNIGQNETITIDNINDINLGGNINDMIEIKNDENNNIENNKKENNSNLQKTTESFFESKPLENNFDTFEKKTNLDKIHSFKNDNYKETQNKTYGGIFSNNTGNSDFIEKKEENPSNELYDDENERDTIQVNANQNINAGLEDMIFNELENNEDNIKMNTGRESDNHIGLQNTFQMSKYDMRIQNENNKEDKEDHHIDRIKSYDTILSNSKDKLKQLEKNNSNNIIIEGNKADNNVVIKEEKKENQILEINNNNQINIENKNQNKILEINNNNQIKIENKNKENKLEIENNSINIENNYPVNRKRTVVDVGPNKLSSEKVLGIVKENNEEIKGRNRNKTLLTVNNSSNLDIRKKNGFISLEEQEKIENNNYDYCSLFHEDFVKNKLRTLQDNGNEKNIYSDQIFLLSDKKKLEKRLILLTPSYLYIIESKEAQFVLTLNKNEINKIAISNQNLNILAFIKNDGVNILLLTLRRMDLLYYLRDYYRKSIKIPLRFTYQDEYKVKIKGKDCNLSVKDKIFTTLSNFDGAIKIGYLQKLNPHLKHFKLFNQRLVVLSSIGLIVFDDPTKPPERLYPIIGSEIKQVSPQKYKKSNCFEIKTLAGEVKVFAAYKEREMTSWLEEFNKVKEDFKKKMKKLDTANKIEFIDNNNALPNVEEEKAEEELLPNSKNDI